ncbi:hypothetical protein N658DRAFT_322766 [Parathielavia hyrcaniae]|uniref:Uncharacterized protein n=1 Tax=Parathielavia hyrcaniae TaxID=113614 RepID=A0AAN6Q5T3_9PEZI|nr:hypothetical protein N658DRAFT_322766 [Parathielavia hyrcaniae]
MLNILGFNALHRSLIGPYHPGRRRGFESTDIPQASAPAWTTGVGAPLEKMPNDGRLSIVFILVPRLSFLDFNPWTTPGQPLDCSSFWQRQCFWTQTTRSYHQQFGYLYFYLSQPRVWHVEILEPCPRVVFAFLVGHTLTDRCINKSGNRRLLGHT